MQDKYVNYQSKIDELNFLNKQFLKELEEGKNDYDLNTKKLKENFDHLKEKYQDLEKSV